MFALRNKKGRKARWAVTRWYAGKRRGRARGKGHADIILVQLKERAIPDSMEGKNGGGRTVKKDGDKLDDARARNGVI